MRYCTRVIPRSRGAGASASIRHAILIVNIVVCPQNQLVQNLKRFTTNIRQFYKASVLQDWQNQVFMVVKNHVGVHYVEANGRTSIKLNISLNLK